MEKVYNCYRQSMDLATLEIVVREECAAINTVHLLKRYEISMQKLKPLINSKGGQTSY